MHNINAEMGNLSIGEIVNRPEFGKRQNTGSSKSANSGMPTHPAITSENEGEGLEINIDFRNGSELLKDANTLDEALIESLFDILARYKGITKRFAILVRFGKHWTESAPLKEAQSALIRRVAKMIQTFPGLKSVEIGFDMNKKNWAQLKNAAYFYQLDFSGWTFHYKVAKGAWEKMETRSALDRRLVGHRFALQSKKEL
jgi:hypothetical protein